MNNKAILPAEVVKIVLAVLSIVVLVYLGVSLAGIMTQMTKLAQAKNLLQTIKDKVEWMEEEEERVSDENILLASPEGWYILKGDVKNQLCICKEADTQSCYIEGVCEVIDVLVHMVSIGGIQIIPSRSRHLVIKRVQESDGKYTYYFNDRTLGEILKENE